MESAGEWREKEGDGSEEGSWDLGLLGRDSSVKTSLDVTSFNTNNYICTRVFT